MENVLETPSLKDLDLKVRNLRYTIRQTEFALKQNAAIFDANTQKAMRNAIARDKRSLLTAEEDFDGKLKWHVNAAVDHLLERMMGQTTERESVT
jgi:hypothetical protein